jgi:Raf kinase inhibitor-like YbhB/YbcL family protein
MKGIGGINLMVANRLYLFLLLAALFPACSRSDINQREVTSMTPEISFSLNSSAFQEGDSIPEKFSCRGEDVSPELSWNGQPAQTASLALTVIDPDARDFVHWSVWNIQPETGDIPEGSVPGGAVQGRNNFGNVGWGGPCPPSGSHHYVFTLYALDTDLDLADGSSLNDLQAAMENHILAQAQLTGVFP